MSDWNEVTVLTKNNSRANAKSKSAVTAAQRKGEEIETLKKRTAAQNKQHTVDKNTTKLSEETEDFHHERVSVDVSRLIQQARQDKGFTQKDLATKINEKPQIIAEYEQGKAIPNQAILIKIEKVLGVKLRGKEKGQMLETKAKK